MASPHFLEEKPLSLVDVKHILEKTESRDTQLNHLSGKVKDYLSLFVEFSPKKKEELRQQLVDLQLTRLKEEHMIKIIDFLPRTLNDLKIVLQAYPLSLPKKDQESIVQVIQDTLK